MNYDTWLSTDPRERQPAGRAQSYVCLDCRWTGTAALDHHRQTGHALRGRDWPPDWPDAVFTVREIDEASDRDAEQRSLRHLSDEERARI